MSTYVEKDKDLHTLCVRGSRYIIYDSFRQIATLDQLRSEVVNFDDEVYDIFRETVKFNSGDVNFGVVSSATGIFNVYDPITKRTANRLLFACDNIRRNGSIRIENLTTSRRVVFDLPIRVFTSDVPKAIFREEYTPDEDSNIRKHIEHMRSDIENVINVDFSESDFSTADEVKSYVKTEYANHLYDAISVLYSVQNLGDKVNAIGDGVGVVKSACELLGVDCVSSDSSKAMVAYAHTKGVEVLNMDFKDACKLEGTIVLQNLLRNIPCIASYIAVNYPFKQVIIIDDEEFFDGKEFFVSANVMEDGVYLRNISVNSYKYKLSYPIKSRGLVWSKFFMPNLVYMIDDPIGAKLMKQHQYWGSEPKVCARKMKFLVGMKNVVPHTYKSVYLFWNTIQPGYDQYFSMKLGRYISLRLDLDFEPKKEMTVEEGYMFAYDGSVRGSAIKKVHTDDNEIYYYVSNSGEVKLYGNKTISKVYFIIRSEQYKTV